MDLLLPSAGETGSHRAFATRLAEERRMIGRVAGVTITFSAVVALAATRLLSPDRVPASFDLVVAVTLLLGIASTLTPWDRLPARWLHAIPACGTLLTAIGIKLGHLDPSVADNYYVVVAAFAAYAFSSRREVALQVALAAAAWALPLLQGSGAGSLAPARTLVGMLMLVVIAGIVTVLREGLQKRQRELEDLAVRDPLTGVGNYRLLAGRLEYEIARHRRSGGSLTVMVLDLDGFKQINDMSGHLVGDGVLRDVAGALASTLRAQDTLVRQGGDEFCILAPATGEDQARLFAARVQDAVTDTLKGTVTTSVGWATFPVGGTDSATLLALADADLRCAKQRRGVPGRLSSRVPGRVLETSRQ